LDAILAAAPHWFTYPGKHEVAFHLWRLSIRWYGLSYLFGAILVYLQLQSRASRERTGMTVDQAQEFVVYAMIGVILGGRALFMLLGILYERYGTYDMRDYGGLAAKLPWMVTFFVITTLSVNSTRKRWAGSA